jgi:hypothetical protein
VTKDEEDGVVEYSPEPVSRIVVTGLEGWENSPYLQKLELFPRKYF